MGEPSGPELANTIAETAGSGEGRPELAATLADSGVSSSTKNVDGMPELARGATIGRYILLDVLGAGGMGVVYRAYDPELDRKVALKLVRHDARNAGDSDGRGRMLREAQAIARLSHPNVVAVHDVGTIDQQVFIAMELVEGETLARWLRERVRPVAEVLDVVVQAGRGLAAAHRSGLVHRDFKPENVLVGRDGRARVVDFGLVREVDGRPAFDTLVELQVRPSVPMLAPPLTQVGAVVGTPLYMAPEQMLERAIDARTDQYSFCVALYESLAGRLPFHGDDFAELKAKVIAGGPPELPAARKVPAHIAAAIRRGMSLEPAARWPSMDVLLDELARNPAARRRRWLAAGAAVALLGLAATIPLLARGREASQCGGAADQFAGTWGPARRQALHTSFAGTQAPYAEAAFGAVARRLDQYGTSWVTSYEDSCKATHERGEQSVEMLDLRTACLRRRRIEVAALVELLLEADARGVQRAHTAIAALSPVDDCNDLAALQSPIKLPIDDTARRAIADIHDELARVQAAVHAGRYKVALPRSEALLVRARALAYRPLEAEVGAVFGQLQNRTGELDAAQRTLVVALAAATASRHDEVAARIATGLVQVAAGKEEFAHGHDWAALAEALVERLGNPPIRRAYVHYSKAYLLSGEGKYPAAAEEYERSLAIRERVAPGSQDVGRALSGLANVYDEIGRYADARAAGERALALQQAELGPSHPEIAGVLVNLGNIASDEGDLPAATRYYERALAIREESVTIGDAPSLLANVINNLGTVAQEQGRFDDALAHHRRALAIRETIDADGADVAMSLSNIATAQRGKGEHATALAGYRRALAIAERLGKDHPFVGDALHGIGECTWRLHELAEAQAVLERALAIRRLGARPIEVAEVEFALARTLWDRAQRDRAVQLAGAARTAFAASPAGKRGLVELDDWLRTRSK